MEGRINRVYSGGFQLASIVYFFTILGKSGQRVHFISEKLSPGNALAGSGDGVEEVPFLQVALDFSVNPYLAETDRTVIFLQFKICQRKTSLGPHFIPNSTELH